MNQFWNNVKEFMTGKFLNTNVDMWIVITAIVAAVLLLIIVISVAATSLKRKKKRALADAQKANIISNVNKQDKVDDNILGYSAEKLQISEVETNVYNTNEPTPKTNEFQNLTDADLQKENVNDNIILDILVDDTLSESIEKPTSEVEKPEVKQGEDIKEEGVETPKDSKPFVEIEKTPENTNANKINDNNEKMISKPIAKPMVNKSTKSGAVIVGVENLPKKIVKEVISQANETKTSYLKTSENLETFGKYIITYNTEINPIRPYKFALIANNGQLLFESEGYKIPPKENSINAFKRNVKDGTFVVDNDKTGKYRFKLFSVKGALIGVGENYATKTSCENSILSVKRFAESATLVENKTVILEDKEPQQ